MVEKREIPDHRCGFKSRFNYEIVGGRVDIGDGGVCCWRETWRDTDYCEWHAPVENKPIEDLKAARVDGPERLDGAFLAGVKAGDDLSFQSTVEIEDNSGNGMHTFLVVEYDVLS